jgi:hypothetical protein
MIEQQVKGIKTYQKRGMYNLLNPNIKYQIGSDPILTNTIFILECLHHLYIPQESPNDVLSGPKLVVNLFIKHLFV